jgi:serine/threonine-protein kinase
MKVLKRWAAQPDGPMPPEVAAAAARSLGSLALTVSAMTIVVLVLDHWLNAGAIGGGPIRWTSHVARVVLSFGMYLLCRRSGLEPLRLLDVGIGYQVLSGLIVAVSFREMPFLSEAFPEGWSPVAVWVLVYPLVVPSSRDRAIFGSLATAATEAVAGSISFSTVIAALIAPIASRIVYGLALEVARAHDMGSYKLLERIGQGGMGEVWRAQHTMLARSSVIKLIRRELLGAAGQTEASDIVRRFEREARATAALRSPHTIEVYDFGTTRDGTFYYVMEHLEGFSLEALVQRFGPVPQGRAVRILRQACESLAEAHQAGLIHRDVKPANLFLSRRGLQPDFVKVLDFGLVKRRDGRADVQLTAAETLLGTPAYMPPEMALGESDVDARADIYALGCVAYWLLTGRLVFPGDNPMKMLVAHIRTAPDAPSKHAPQAISPALEALVLRCLEKRPADRPQTAQELGGLLGQLHLDGEWSHDDAEAWWASPRTESTPEERAPGVELLETLSVARG